MNWDHFKKKNLGKYVRLQPPAQFMDQIANDDEVWVIYSFPSPDSVLFLHERTGVTYEAGKDLIHNYTTDFERTRNDPLNREHAVLMLRGQFFVNNGNVDIKLSSRPGEIATALQSEQWTPLVPYDISEFVPSTASNISIQYSLKSSNQHVPLIIAIGTQDYRPALVQYSGLAGVVEVPLLSGERKIFVSVSHPTIEYKLSVLGWTDNL